MTESQQPPITARGNIAINLFTTLDGVVQSPGSPEEDPSGGFEFGGWQTHVQDAMVGEKVMDYVNSMDALLLGRRTYDIFASYWPNHTEGGPGAIGRVFNRVPKYVATRHPLDPEWENTTVLGPEILSEVDALRDRHRDIRVIGSASLARALLNAGLFDELCMWVYPIVLGAGKRIFSSGLSPSRIRLIESPLVGDNGVIQLRYAPGAHLFAAQSQ